MATDMNYELLINCIPGELRVALLEENIVQEVHVEREDESSIVGNIYLAKVVRAHRHRDTYTHTDRHTDTHKHRHTNTQTHIHTDTQTH